MYFSFCFHSYTNVGKSALFNRLTKASAEVDDALFATLDPKIRACYLPQLGASCLLADTVGFVQDLPHSLVKAFGSTLEEVLEADIIVHVQDASLPSEVVVANARSVHSVLSELGMQFVRINEAPPMQKPGDRSALFGAWPWPGRTPLLEIWNKVDLVEDEAMLNQVSQQSMPQRLEHNIGGQPDLCISAKTGSGMVELVEQISCGLALTGAEKKLQSHNGSIIMHGWDQDKA